MIVTGHEFKIQPIHWKAINVNLLGNLKVQRALLRQLFQSLESRNTRTGTKHKLTLEISLYDTVDPSYLQKNNPSQVL